MDINAEQLRCIKTLVGKLKIKDADMRVAGFTSMRTIHVSEMHMDEATAMIKHLKSLDPEEAKAEKMRKKIFAMAYEIHLVGRNANAAQKKAVRESVTNWCKKYSYLAKDINLYKYNELTKLVSQFEKVYGYYLKKV